VEKVFVPVGINFCPQYKIIVCCCISNVVKYCYRPTLVGTRVDQEGNFSGRYPQIKTRTKRGRHFLWAYEGCRGKVPISYCMLTATLTPSLSGRPSIDSVSDICSSRHTRHDWSLQP
jgi:hypothetical protein